MEAFPDESLSNISSLFAGGNARSLSWSLTSILCAYNTGTYTKENLLNKESQVEYLEV